MKNLIIKVLTELEKPEPKLDYVRGILETILETKFEEDKYPNGDLLVNTPLATTNPLNISFEEPLLGQVQFRKKG